MGWVCGWPTAWEGCGVLSALRHCSVRLISSPHLSRELGLHWSLGIREKLWCFQREAVQASHLRVLLGVWLGSTTWDSYLHIPKLGHRKDSWSGMSHRSGILVSMSRNSFFLLCLFFFFGSMLLKNKNNQPTKTNKLKRPPTTTKTKQSNQPGVWLMLSRWFCSLCWRAQDKPWNVNENVKKPGILGCIQNHNLLWRLVCGGGDKDSLHVCFTKTSNATE